MASSVRGGCGRNGSLCGGWKCIWSTFLSMGLPGVWAGGIGFLDTLMSREVSELAIWAEGNRIKVCNPQKIVIRLGNL